MVEYRVVFELVGVVGEWLKWIGVGGLLVVFLFGFVEFCVGDGYVGGLGLGVGGERGGYWLVLLEEVVRFWGIEMFGFL